MTLEAIAKRLELSVGSIRTHYHHIKQKLALVIKTNPEHRLYFILNGDKDESYSDRINQNKANPLSSTLYDKQLNDTFKEINE